MLKILLLLSILFLITPTQGRSIKLTPDFLGSNNLVSIDQYSNKVQIAVGDVLDIKVRENPTTGYVWIENAISNQGVLTSFQEESIGSRYVVDDHLPGMTGVGGENHFYYKAIAPGATIVKLVHKRSWENYNINELEIEVTVVLK